MSELLHIGIVVLPKALDGSLEDKVERGIEARVAKGSVAAVVTSDLLEVPQNILKSCKVSC